MANLLAEIRRLNGLGNLSVAEPFAGGAGASLSLLFQEETQQIFVNDLDTSIFSFWWTIVHRPQPFIDRLRRTRVSMVEWRRQRDIFRTCTPRSRLAQGFAAFYLNRCNRSGIIMNGGPIGGQHQRGPWKLNARFNKEELIARCERVSEYRDRIQVSDLDGIDFVRRCDPESVFLFIDPPYFAKGALLYLNALEPDYHRDLATLLQERPGLAWVLTYDDCPEIRSFYRGWARIRPFTLRYSAAERRQGAEVLITPKWLRLPGYQSSAALAW